MEEDIFAKAKLFHHLIHEKGTRIVDLSKKFGIKPSYICHILRLNRLPEIIVDGYYSKLISLSHLFIISRLKDKKKLLEVYEQVLAKDFTVQETEEAIREILHQVKTEGSYLTKEEKETLVHNIGKDNQSVKAKIIQTRIKGKIIVEIKGSLAKTTAFIKKIVNAMTEKKD